MAPSPLQAKRVATTALSGFAVLVAIMLLVGALGELLVFDSTVGRLELEWTDWIARHRVGVLDSMAAVGSSFTDTWTVIGTAFGASAMLWLTGYRSSAFMLPIGLALDVTVFLTVSTTIIGRDRPDVTPLGSVPSTSSFPSGHVAAGVVLYGGLVLVAASIAGSKVGRVAAGAATFVVVYVALSRVYEGVHHPTDVIGGAALGVGVLFVAAMSTRVVVPSRRANGARVRFGERRVGVTSS